MTRALILTIIFLLTSSTIAIGIHLLERVGGYLWESLGVGGLTALVIGLIMSVLHLYDILRQESIYVIKKRQKKGGL